MNGVIRSLIRETDDRRYDPWGAVIRHGFAIAEVLSAPECNGSVPAELNFRHGAYHPLTFADFLAEDAAGSGEWYVEAQYVEALQAGEVTVADIAHAGRVVGRHLDYLQHLGCDY